MTSNKLYWEDFQVGHVDEFGEVTVTKDDILDFARKFDPQPFHVDEEAARQSLFGGLCASGWHTAAIAMRILCDNVLNRSASLGSPGIDHLRWLKPVFPGDRLRLRFVILESRPLNSRPQVGMIRTRWKMINQDNEEVAQLEGNIMMGRRPG